MRFKWAWVVVSAIACGFAPGARGDVLTVLPSKDSSLLEDPSGSVSGGASSALYLGRLGANGGNLKRRAVMAFDLSSIPTNAVVTQVSLTLTLLKGNGGDTPVTLHRLTQNWGEGTSSGGPQGALSTPGSATWIHTSYSGAFWTNPGGDFDPTTSATQVVGSFGAPVWDSTTSGNQRVVNDAQGWVSNPASNFGWILLGDEVNTSTAKEFGSRELSFGQPTLTVTYSVPEPGTLGVIGIMTLMGLGTRRSRIVIA
jgi:hypothetical protein